MMDTFSQRMDNLARCSVRCSTVARWVHSNSATRFYAFLASFLKRAALPVMDLLNSVAYNVLEERIMILRTEVVGNVVLDVNYVRINLTAFFVNPAPSVIKQ